jgi:plasmid replication initiation protein
MSEQAVKFDPQNYSDDKLAVQSNDVLFGQQSFTNLQRRIYLLAISQIKRTDNQLRPYRVHIEDLKEYGVSDNIYSHMDRVTDGLMRKVFKRRIKENGKRGWEKWPMISWAKYIEGQGYIEIELHREMEELLLNLKEKGNFTPVPIANATACGSIYGSRIYAMLYSWRQHNKMEISVSELRTVLKLEDQYKNFAHFRKRVLKKAQKDLQKHTNMRFTWEELKKARGRGKGRKVTHLVFEFHFVADQMNMALEEPEKKPVFEPKFNLDNRLKNNAKLSKKQLHITLKWLSNNQDQQWPMAYWMAKKVEVDTPTDGNDNAIREINKWAWARIEEAMENGSFPEPDNTPEEVQQMSKEELEKDLPGYDESNPFNDMRPE